MEHDRLIMTPEDVLSRVDENTIGVVPTLGVTFTCQYEPVAAVAEALVTATEPLRERRRELRADRKHAKQVLRASSAEAREIARATLAEVRERTGLPSLPRS